MTDDALLPELTGKQAADLINQARLRALKAIRLNDDETLVEIVTGLDSFVADSNLKSARLREMRLARIDALLRLGRVEEAKSRLAELQALYGNGFLSRRERWRLRWKGIRLAFRK